MKSDKRDLWTMINKNTLCAYSAGSQSPIKLDRFSSKAAPVNIGSLFVTINRQYGDV